MIAFLGDIHGSANALQRAINAAVERGATALIQVGDFGWYQNTVGNFKRVDYKIPVYWIDGNHEDHALIEQGVDINPNCIYMPRGTVAEIAGKKIGFLGGAASVDKEIRLRQGVHWSDKELIEEADIAKFDEIDYLDFLVTHTPPQSTIDKHFDPKTLLWFGLNPKTWFDPSARHVENLWNRLGNPKLICGHMHRAVTDRTVRILNIEDLIFYP